jgi:hypothetical protein
MPYYVNKTNGTAIVVLDGTKDTTSTSLTLFGRLVQNYGDQTNENFVHLLENFALSTSPSFPTIGQLWYDTSVNNIKAYTTANTWVTVGSVIQGNVQLTGNLFVGPNGFQIQDLGNVAITNKVNGGDISFYSNIGGTKTQVLLIKGSDGRLEVNANATSNFGVTTKIYVDSEIARASSGGDIKLLSNVAIINANLALRIAAENQLQAAINAANVEIELRDTITRVDQLNGATNDAILANVDIINANLGARYDQIIALELAMLANISNLSAGGDFANASISALDSKIDNINLTRDITRAANLALKANVDSPILTGTPLAPTATFGANTLQIATTQYVMTRSAYWDGSRKFVSTQSPTSADGVDGDIWFKYI